MAWSNMASRGRSRSSAPGQRWASRCWQWAQEEDTRKQDESARSTVQTLYQSDCKPWGGATSERTTSNGILRVRGGRRAPLTRGRVAFIGDGVSKATFKKVQELLVLANRELSPGCHLDPTPHRGRAPLTRALQTQGLRASLWHTTVSRVADLQ